MNNTTRSALEGVRRSCKQLKLCNKIIQYAKLLLQKCAKHVIFKYREMVVFVICNICLWRNCNDVSMRFCCVDFIKTKENGGILRGNNR